MDILLPQNPGRLAYDVQFGYYTVRSVQFHEERCCTLWSSLEDPIKETIPTYFVEKHRGHFNNVIHAKPLGSKSGQYGSFYDSDGRVYTGYMEGMSTNAQFTIVAGFGRASYLIEVRSPQTRTSYWKVQVRILLGYKYTGNRIRYNFLSWSCSARLYGGSLSISYSRSIIKQGMLADNNLILLSKQLPFQLYDRSSAGDDYWLPGSSEWNDRSIIAHQIYELVRHRHRDWEDEFLSNTSPSYSMLTPIEAVSLLKPKYSFLLGEDSLFNGLMVQRDQSYWIGYLQNESYINACESVPRMSENSISNLLEIGSFLYTLFVKHRVEIPKSASDAWLSYRYVYSTTKLDIKEAVKFFKRRTDLKGLSEYTVYGKSSTIYKDTFVSCRCSFSIKNKAASTMQKLLNVLYEYGLSPNAYVIWDMIPFSFIADWFVPIGDIIGRTESDLHLKQAFDISDVGWSISYSHDDEYTDGIKMENRYYTRMYGSTPPTYRGFYEFENIGASSKTVGYRLLDIASLILG